MRHVLCLLVLALAISSASAETLTTTEQTNYRGEVPYGGVFGWSQQETEIVGVGWEYYIDFYSSGEIDGAGYWIGGFDPTNVQNFADMPYVRDIWSYENFGRGTDFEMPTTVHGIGDYLVDSGYFAAEFRCATHDGTVAWGPPSGVVETDRMWIANTWQVQGLPPGLLMTWRFVLSERAFDGDIWVAMNGQPAGFIFNLPIRVGDFNDDRLINAADIDDLCDQIGGPYDAEFDLDNGTGTGTADGVVDDIDLIYLIEELVEWDNGVDSGDGTKQGDFNLDGVVNATDLAIMKGTFGTSGVGYADGNANCDDVVNATDLAILKGSFGFVAPTGGGVPEPLSIVLLSAGGLALLRRKRR